MGNLDDFLVLKPKGSLSSEGGGGDGAIQADLDSPLKATAVGLKLIDAPNRLSNGLAYRMNGCTLERILVSEGSDDDESSTRSNAAKVVGTCSLSPSSLGAVHLKASPDGRMVAVACIDGSLQCFDSTSTGMSLRWSISNAHSHVSPNIYTTVSKDRSHAACASGPVLALDFSPHDYTLVLVDAAKGMAIYDARVAAPTNMVPTKNAQVQELLQNVSCASWRASFSTKDTDESDGDTTPPMPIAIGRYDGSVAILRYSHPKAYTDADPAELLQSISEFGRPSDEDGFVCTHLNWTVETLVAGLCLVVPPEDDEEPDEDDEDDFAEHEACLYVTTVDETFHRSVDWSEQGDVVPFFTVPKFGRHVFFTSILSSPTRSRLIAVATNVGTDIGTISPDDDDETSWKPVEFQEGSSATTPTNEDDEFVFPLGICVVQLSSSSFRLLLASTDGSLSTFEYQHMNDPTYFSGPALGSVANLPSDPLDIITSPSASGASTPDNASWVVVDEKRKSAIELALTPAKPESSVGFSSSSGSTSASGISSSNDEAQDTTANSAAKKSTLSFGATGSTAFGSGFGSPSAFGSGGSSGLTFGSPPTGSSPFSAFGKKAGDTTSPSIFGATSSLGGTTSSAFGTTSSLGGTASSAFGTTSSLGATASSAFGTTSSLGGTTSSAFGTTSSLGGTASSAFGTTSSLGGGTATPTPANVPKKPAATFGFSGSTFGSAAAASSTGGFAALSTSSKSTETGSGGFAIKAGTTGGSAFGSSKTPFKTFSNTFTPSSTVGGFPVKPLFGSASTKSSATSDSNTPTTGRDQSSQVPSKTPTSKTEDEDHALKSKELIATKETNESNDGSLSEVEKTAARVFDELDTAKSGSVDVSTFEDLSEALGEGFHGDEYDAQVALVDPSKTGCITRINFIKWYKSLVEGGDDDSLDTADLEEREEEKESAKTAFGEHSKTEEGKAYIDSTEFGKVIESLGSVYCEEEHKKTIKKLRKDKRIYESDFLDWYVDWLFGDGDDSDDDDSDGDDDSDDGGSAGNVADSGDNDEENTESLGNFFKVDDSTWKCDVCSVRNKDTLNKCVACDSIRPGFEGTDAALGGAPAKVGPVSSSSIGAGGFSFGGATAKPGLVSSSSIGAGGFSFGGSTAKADTVSSSSIGAGGFSFGGSTTKADTSSSAGAGFSFGGATSKTSSGASSSIGSGGFSFGATAEAKGYNTLTPTSSKAPTSSSIKPAPKSVAKAPVNTSASAAFPPMSKKAPTPFGGKLATKAPASSAAFPPMSKKAPTPFGGKPVTKAPTSSAAFPPMSSKAPTPFGGKPAVKAPASSAAFPPMSKKAPTPFGGKPAAKAPVSSSANAAFPPMSSKAPTPFGAKLVAKAPVSGSANAAFPPMSSKAPTPFGAKPAATINPFSPFGTKAVEKAPSSSPFGAFGAKSTGISPSSPFGAMGNTSAGNTHSNSNPFGATPTVSSKAPSPFGAKPVAKARTSASANAAFPPMPSKAPTPFGAKPLAKAPVSGSANAGFPPMSSKAPTPFGGKPATKAPASGSANAAFPPMSSKAPTPFGAKPVAKGRTSGSANAAFPPMSSKAPNPFGAKASNTLDKSPALSMKTIPSSSPVMSTRLGGSLSQNSKSQVLVAEKKKSQLQLQLDSVISSFSSTLAEVSQMRAKVCAGDREIRKGIEEFAIQVEQERSKLLNVDDSLGKNRAETAFLLSRKTDSSRQIDAANKIVQEIKLSNTEGTESVAGSQALDQKSETQRRRFAASSRSLVRKMALAKERAELLEATSNDQGDGQRGVLQGVMNIYKRSKKFEEVSSRIVRNIDVASKTVPYRNRTKRTTGRSTYSLEGSSFESPKRHNKLRPIRIESRRQDSTQRQAVKPKSLVSHWKNIESSLQQIGSNDVKIDRFNTLSIEATKDQVSRPRSEIGQQRLSSHSLLMSPSAKSATNQLQERTLTVSNKISIFSPPSKTKVRSGWDKPSTIDKNRMNQLSLNAPRDLKQTTLSNASRETLASFGTTPEKLRAAIDIKKNEATSLPTSKDRGESKDGPMKRSTGAAAAFPPLSNKAPTNPFSTGKKRETLTSISSEKNSAQKSTSSSAPLPPMPKQAPKNPFSKGPAPKTLSTQVQSKSASRKSSTFAPSEKSASKESQVRVSSAAFGNMKGLGDSLFSSGSAKTDAMQKPSFGALNPTQAANSSDTSMAKDYNAILTSFYEKHNPSRVGEVAKTLVKYKGREPEMFQKLSSKYKVPNPLQESSNPLNSAATSAGFSSSSSGFGKLGSASSGFGNTGSEMGASPFASVSGTPTQQKTTVSSSPFGNSAPSSSAFGSSAGDNASSKSGMFQPPSQSPFSTSNSQTTSTPFGTSSAQAQSPFGSTASSANNSSPFGATGGMSSASPFGNTAAPTPFGAPSSSPMQPNSQRLFNGKTARDLLHQFYQEKNPSKVAEVDKVLAKYSGKEEQMFRNLAKKYQLDPSVFGIAPGAPTPTSGFGSPAAAPAFGQASTMGSSASPFGQSPGGFGQPSTFGGGVSSMSAPKPPGQTFGSGATPGFGSSVAAGFGSLAQSNPSPFGGQPSSGFGAPAPTAFGSPTPFGAPRR